MQNYIAKGLVGKSGLGPPQPFALENREVVCRNFFSLFFFFILSIWLLPMLQEAKLAHDLRLQNWTEAGARWHWLELEAEIDLFTILFHFSATREQEINSEHGHSHNSHQKHKSHICKHHRVPCGRCFMAATYIHSKMLWVRTSSASVQVSHHVQWI